MKLVVLCVAVFLAAVSADNSLVNPLPPTPSEGIRIWTIEDTQVPFISQLRGQITECDVTSGSASWSYTVLASDLGAPASGVANVALAFWSPNGRTQSQGFCSQGGGANLGVWSCTGFVDKWDIPGQWPLAWVNATDFQGNTASLGYDTTKNAAAYITVIGPEDNQPPALTYFSYTQNSLSIDSVTSRHQPYTILSNCTDNYSGCSRIGAVFLAPGSSGDPFLAVRKDLRNTPTYHAHYNTWSSNLTTTDGFVSPAQADGDWTLFAVYVSDEAGNVRVYYANELAGLFNAGSLFPAVNVVGQPRPPSIPAPQLISYNHDVSEIDLKLGDQRVCFNTTSTGDNYLSPIIQHYIFLSGPTQTTITCGPTYATQPPPQQPTSCYRSRVVDPVNPTVPLNQTLLRHCIDFRTFTSRVRQGFYRIVGIGLRTPQGNSLYGACSGGNMVTNRFFSDTCSNSDDNIGCRPEAICGEVGSGANLQASVFIASLALIVALFH